jgi:hypothetical protein
MAWMSSLGTVPVVPLDCDICSKKTEGCQEAFCCKCPRQGYCSDDRNKCLVGRRQAEDAARVYR